METVITLYRGKKIEKVRDDMGIYIIRCKVNGLVYVGASMNVTQRIRQHKQGLRLGHHHEPERLLADVKLFGIENFTFDKIASCPRHKYIYEAEQEVIQQYMAGGFSLYNTRKACG